MSGKEQHTPNRYLISFIKYAFYILVGIFLLFALLYLALQLPASQQYMLKRANAYLSELLHTQVNIQSVDIILPKYISINETLIVDQSQDTLMYFDGLSVNIGLTNLIWRELSIDHVYFNGLKVSVSEINDSTSNYSFIQEAFAVENGIEEDTISNSSWRFSLDEVTLEDINIKYNSDKDSLKVISDFDALALKLNNFDLKSNHVKSAEFSLSHWTASINLPNQTTHLNLNQQHIILDELAIEKSLVHISELSLDSLVINYQNLGPPVSSTTQSHTSRNISDLKIPWNIRADNIKVDNSSFIYNDQTKKPLKTGFDPNHLQIHEFNTAFSEVLLDDSNISINLKTMKCKEINGLDVTNFSSLINISNDGFQIEDLKLNTPKSKIEASLILDYANLQTLINQPQKVLLEHKLNLVSIDKGDILYFVPALDTLDFNTEWVNKISIQSSITGSLPELKVDLTGVDNTSAKWLELNGQINNVLNLDSTTVKLNIKTYPSLYESLKPSLSTLGTAIHLPSYMTIDAQINGGLHSGAASLSLHSDQGKISINGSYKTPAINPVIDMRASIEQINLKYLLADVRLGLLDLNLDFHGKGSNLENLSGTITSKINQFDWSGYRYHHLLLNASSTENIANIRIESDDPNLNLDWMTSIDYGTNWPHTTTTLDIHQLRLKALGFTQDQADIQGQFIVDTKGLSIDSLKSRFEAKEAKITTEDQVYDLNQSSADVQINRNYSHLNLDFPFFQAYFDANFSFMEIKKAVQSMLSPNLVTYKLDSLNKPYYKMDFGVRSIDHEIIQSMFLPDLDSLKLNTLQATYDESTNQLNMIVDLPKLSYGVYQIDSLLINAEINTTHKNISASMSEFTWKDKKSHSIHLFSTLLDDHLMINTKFIDDENLVPFAIKMAIMNVDSGYHVNIENDSLLIGNEPWQINKDNSIFLGKQRILVQQLDLFHKNESIAISGHTRMDSIDFNVDFDQLNIDQIGMLLDQNTLDIDGILTGGFKIQKSNEHQHIQSAISIDTFTYQKDTLGSISASLNSTNSDSYQFQVELNGSGNGVNAEGVYFINQDSLDANLTLSTLQLASLEAITGDQIKNLKGNMVGQMKIIGSISKPSLYGFIGLKKVSFNTTFLGTYFSLDDETIKFINHQIMFNDFNIYDAAKSTATLNGVIRSDDLTNYVFDIKLITDQFQLLDTKKLDDELFYGKLVVNSRLNLRGNSINPVIDAHVKIIGGSNIRILVPENRVKAIEHEGIVDFTLKEQDIVTDSVNTAQSKLFGITLRTQLETDPSAKITILMDKQSGDYLEVQGKSYLSYNINPNGISSLTGTYEVAQGLYQLSFYNLVKKRFSINQGSTVTWIGDPYNAKLNTKATYIVKTTPLPLVLSQVDEASTNVYKQILPFAVGLNIGGEILSPQIGFDISLSEDKQNFQGGVVTEKLNQINKEDSELNKQVFSLLLFNSFLAEDSYSGGNGSTLNNTARNSVSQLLSDQLNKLSGKYIQSVNLNFGVNSYNDYTTGTASGTTDLTLQLSKELFNERLVVTVGSNLELEGEEKDNSLNNLAQDIILEYKIDEKGVFRLNAFRKNQYDGIIDGELTKTGVGLSINKSYNSWRDLINQLSAKKKRIKDNE